MNDLRGRLIIDRQVAMVIGAALGAVLIAMIGVSAHAGTQPILQLAGVHEVETADRDAASGARTELADTSEHDRAGGSPRPQLTQKPRPTTTPSPGQHSSGSDH